MGTSYGALPRSGKSFLCANANPSFALDAFDYSGSGTTWVDSVGTNNATLVDSPTYNGSGAYYFDFDGSSNDATFSTITFGNGSWTVIIWANADSMESSAHGGLMSNSSGGPVTNSFGMMTDGIAYTNYDGTWNSHYGGTSLSTGTWYQLVWVNTSSTMIMYLNGSADIASFDSTTSNGGPCNVVGARWGAASFNGKIACVQHFTKTFTATEVSNTFQSQRSRFGV